MTQGPQNVTWSRYPPPLIEKGAHYDRVVVGTDYTGIRTTQKW